MSLMKSLARVAAGVLVAKGMSTMMKNRDQSQTASGSTRSRRTGGGLLDQITRGTQSGSGGGLGDLLGGILGGNTSNTATAGTGRRYGGPNSSGATGGLGGILDQISGGNSARTGQSGGGLGDLLGGLLGGAAGGAAAGSLVNKGSQKENDASFGELLNDSLTTGGEPEVAPTPDQNALAGLLLRAMIQAAKADGKIDDAEKDRLLGELGDLDDDERQFVREQMAAPVDAEALARDVPEGAGPQVYMMSVMAIDFDSQEEAQYLHKLAQALKLQPQTVNQIHEKIGVQNLYS
ncbi:MAG: tellurite resistance TerB family protein [Paracoccus denitrificans]|uniref:Tellurite resistance TerB family protein n=1 Tax=Paracoccus denitrificans TaxID=266 RepID=A0A533HXZ3_PARDE|nr:MAG: tellurite resistance TerB family protein [Paracoccus denitrificans]